MGAGTNLLRRGEGLVLRRRVPRVVKAHFRSAFLTVALRTHLLIEGRRMAAHGTRFTDAAFALVTACGCGMSMVEEIERVVVDLLRFELEAREAARAVAPVRAAAEVEAAVRIEAATRAVLAHAIARRDPAVVAAHLRAAVARLGVAVGLVAICEENARRERDVCDDACLLALAPASASARAARAGAPALGSSTGTRHDERVGDRDHPSAPGPCLPRHLREGVPVSGG